MVSVNGMALTVHPICRLAPCANSSITCEQTQARSITHPPGRAEQPFTRRRSPREGLQMVVVPYQSTPQALVGLLSGSAQVFFGNVSDVLELVHSGKARMLAISTDKRVAQFPDVPTVSETVQGFVMTGWIGYFAPTGTPRRHRWCIQALVAICREADLVSTMETGVDSVGATPCSTQLTSGVSVSTSVIPTPPPQWKPPAC
jgi:hypothetical protein